MSEQTHKILTAKVFGVKMHFPVLKEYAYKSTLRVPEGFRKAKDIIGNEYLELVFPDNWLVHGRVINVRTGKIYTTVKQYKEGNKGVLRFNMCEEGLDLFDGYAQYLGE